MARYRLYLDESGDHTFHASGEIGRRYLALVGVAVPFDDCRALQSRLEDFKQRHLRYDPDDPPILHREDIIEQSRSFWVLRDPTCRRAFDDDLLTQIEETNFRLFAVVLDKFSHHGKRYRFVRHAYHYCLHAVLERYCGWLDRRTHTGDVMAESRGGTEDKALSEEYRKAYELGTQFLEREVAQRVLTSREIKLKPKRQNIAGLQLADLLAHPACRDVLYQERRIDARGGEFAERLAPMLERSKYNRHVTQGRIRGYGRILLT
jgi:hypothetical protein